MGGDGKKTKKELLAEIRELRQRLSDPPRGDDGPQERSRDPIFAADVGRRTVLKTAWVAPVILSIPTTVGFGRAQVPSLLPSPPTLPPGPPPVLPPSPPPVSIYDCAGCRIGAGNFR